MRKSGAWVITYIINGKEVPATALPRDILVHVGRNVLSGKEHGKFTYETPAPSATPRSRSQQTKDGCLTVKELQQFLKIGANKAYELVHTEGFPSVRIGRRVIIPRDLLAAWLNEHEGS